MNSLINKVQLIGHLGAAPEVKTLDNGNTVAKIRLATSEVYKNAKGEKITDTQWHNLTAWGKTAEIMGKYLNKGSYVMIEGRLTHGEYTDKDSQKRYATDIIVNEMMMLDKKDAA